MISYFVGKTTKDLKNAYNEIMRKTPVYATSNGYAAFIGELNVQYESRILYFAYENSSRLRGAKHIFRTTADAIAWLLGDVPSLRYDNYVSYYKKHDESALWKAFRDVKKTPAIKKIDRNIKKDKLYTTVVWDDGSSATVVKIDADDEREDIFQAVASAIAIKLYGSNSAFQREVLSKKKEEDFDNAKKEQTIV